MVTLSLKVSNQLAKQLVPLQNHLPEIIELGLRHWQEQEDEQAPLTPRQRVEKLWMATGLIVPLDQAIVNRYPVGAEAPTGLRPLPRTRQAAVQTGGKPASQIIIEQRGAQ